VALNSRAFRSVGRPRQASAADSRALLLDAAVGLFAEFGIAGTSTAKIAAKGGVTAAMVHYYFADREQLIDAVAAERLQPIVTAVWSPVVDSREIEPMLHGLVQRIVSAAAANPWLPSIWLREVISEGGQLRARLLKKLPLEHVKHLVNTVTAAQRRGELSPELEPRLVYVSVLGLTMLPLASFDAFKQVPILRDIERQDIARHAQALLASAFARRTRQRTGST
jgi:AcrR family transcriptional regulator